MLKKKILSLIFFIIVTNCDYKPVYLDNKETNLDIVILNQNGDNEINNYIYKQLKQKSKNNSSKKFNVDLNSKFQKIIIAKNSKGTATDFEIKLKKQVNADWDKAIEDPYPANSALLELVYK